VTVSKFTWSQRSWRAGTVVGYDAITNSIQKLRKALGDDPRDPQFIKTVSKKGYILVATVQPVGKFPASVFTGYRPRIPITTGLLAVLAGLVLAAFAWVWLRENPGQTGALPSIAVMPFEILGDRPEQQYFADGLTDDLITDLTKISSLLVISRESTFQYRKLRPGPRKLGEELGARYMLDGSVRRDGNRLRLNVQLIDTKTEKHLWAERYDAEVKEIFRVQDQLRTRIVSALAIRLTETERQYLFQRKTGNIEAYEIYLQGVEKFFRHARDNNAEARELFRRAIELDPKFAQAHAMLAWTHAFDFMSGWSQKPEQSLELGERFATKALKIDSALPVAYFVRGLVYRERGQYEKALVESEKAIQLDPNYANGYVLHATLLYYAGRPEKGLQEMIKAIELNPHHPHNYPFHLGQAYFVMRRLPEAIAAFEKGLSSNPKSERLRAWLAAAYAQNNQIKDAEWQLELVLLANPDFSIERQKKAFPFKNPSDLNYFVDGLKKAGAT